MSQILQKINCTHWFIQSCWPNHYCHLFNLHLNMPYSSSNAATHLLYPCFPFLTMLPARSLIACARNYIAALLSSVRSQGAWLGLNNPGGVTCLTADACNGQVEWITGDTFQADAVPDLEVKFNGENPSNPHARWRAIGDNFLIDDNRDARTFNALCEFTCIICESDQ